MATAIAFPSRISCDVVQEWNSPSFGIGHPSQGHPHHCSQIVILEGEKDRHLAKGLMFEQTVILEAPGPYQLAAARAGLNRMTPLLCQSIGRIAFGQIPQNTTIMGTVNSFGAGDMILINTNGELSEESLEKMVSRRLFLQRTIIHEAGHSAETLLNLESSKPPKGYGGKWSTAAREMAAEAVKQTRMGNGLTSEWTRLHKSFSDFGWAVDYPSPFEDADTRMKWTRRQVTDGGFMSWGGARNWAEDIATFIGSTYMSQTITDAYREHGVSEDLREDLGCQEMQAYEEENLPARFAAIYTKLIFLQDLGLVRPADVRACMGDSLELPIDEEGIQVSQSTRLVANLANGLTASIGKGTLENAVFEMTGRGEVEYLDQHYPATLRLRLDLGGRFTDLARVTWPRGIYKLGLNGGNHLEFRLDGPPSGSFDASDGFVLVAEASNDRIAGSIVLQKVFRLDAPVPLHESYDPPLVLRFKNEN